MSREAISVVIQSLATLTLVSQFFLVIFLIVILLLKVDKSNIMIKKIVHSISTNSLSFAFLVAAVATIGSLFLSEVAHFVPCKLCWFQRIFMYPQVIILGIAAIKNEFAIKKYVVTLSAIGLVIAIYHYLLQMSPIPLPCTDEIASCAAKQFASFGYITIPMMSATAFALIILFTLLNRKKE